MMYKHLEEWIDIAIEDGELTEEQSKYLNMKAESYGIDSGEFNYVLKSRLSEKQESLQKDKKKASATPKQDELSDVKK